MGGRRGNLPVLSNHLHRKKYRLYREIPTGLSALGMTMLFTAYFAKQSFTSPTVRFPSAPKKDTPSHGYGNRFAFSPSSKIMDATSFRTGGWNCPPDSSFTIGSIPFCSKKGHPIGVSFFGAGYGNRTRLHGLGSRCITDIRTLRTDSIIADPLVNFNNFLSAYKNKATVGTAHGCSM